MPFISAPDNYGRQALMVLSNILFLLMLLTVSSSLPAQNIPLSQLYRGEVLVGQENLSENQLVRRAFLAMLVKLTGNPQPQTIEGVSAALSDANRLATQVGYVEFNPPEVLRDTILSTDGTPAERIFQARFSPDRVDQWLQQRQVPRWSPERQAISLWLAYEQDFQRQLIMDHDDPLRWLVTQTAQQRGLPLEWPQALRFHVDEQGYEQALREVWGGFHENLPDAQEPILMATAQTQGQFWQVRWRLLNNEQLSSFTSSASDLATALSQGIEIAASRSAEAALILPNVSMTQVLELHIRGIQSSRDYGRVMRELEALSQTESVEVIRAWDDQLEVRLHARAGRQWLQRALGLNAILDMEAADQFSSQWRGQTQRDETLELYLRH